MDNYTFDRLKAFLCRNKGRHEPNSPIKENLSPSSSQGFRDSRIIDMRTSSTDDILNQIGFTPTGSIRMNSHYRKDSETPFDTDISAINEVQIPKQLPSYIYQYGKQVPMFNLFATDNSTPKDSRRESQVNRTSYFSVGNKENTAQPQISPSHATPKKRTTFSYYSLSKSENKRIETSPLNRHTSSVHTTKTPSREHKSSVGYVQEQKKLLDQVKSQAKKDLITKIKGNNLQTKSSYASLDVNRIYTLNSARSRENGNDRLNISDLSFDGLKQLTPRECNQGIESKNDMIEVLLKREPKTTKATPVNKKQYSSVKSKTKEKIIEYEEMEEKKPSRNVSPISKRTPSKSPQPKKAENKNSSTTPKKGPYQESTKRLEAIDEVSHLHEKYKKEIRTLIETIKKEKEQITGELEEMSKELKKYKGAYKKLKKRMKEKEQENSHPKKECYETEMPFCIEELDEKQKYSEKSTEAGSDLLSRVEDVNQDVEKIIKGVKFSSSSNDKLELKKTKVITSIIKDLNIDSKIFFQDTIKDESPGKDHDLKEIVKAQRDIILFLVKKLQYEEKQRLKTEEQANEMIFSMQRTLRQIEEQQARTKKRDTSLMAYDTNRSALSLSNNAL